MLRPGLFSCDALEIHKPTPRGAARGFDDGRQLVLGSILGLKDEVSQQEEWRVVGVVYARDLDSKDLRGFGNSASALQPHLSDIQHCQST